MLSTSINGQGKFSCRRSIRMTVCHRAGFFSLVAELDVRARAQSPGALFRRAGRRATVGISDV